MTSPASDGRDEHVTQWPSDNGVQKCPQNEANEKPACQADEAETKPSEKDAAALSSLKTRAPAGRKFSQAIVTAIAGGQLTI